MYVWYMSCVFIKKDVCYQDIHLICHFDPFFSGSFKCRKRRGPLCAVRDCEPLLEWLKAVDLLVAS